MSGVSAHEVRVHADDFLLRPCPFHSQPSVSSPLIIKPQIQDTAGLGGRPQGKRVGSQTLPPAFLSIQLQRHQGDEPTNCALSFKVQDTAWSYLFNALRIDIHRNEQNLVTKHKLLARLPPTEGDEAF